MNEKRKIQMMIFDAKHKIYHTIFFFFFNNLIVEKKEI
jgi:hypothetical protein